MIIGPSLTPLNSWKTIGSVLRRDDNSREKVQNVYGECAVKGESVQPVQVRSKEVSVRLGSYLGGGKGNRAVEAPGTNAHVGWVSKCAGRNASEA